VTDILENIDTKASDHLPDESSTKTMRAAVITGPGDVRIDIVPLPQPGRGQVRVRLEGCGVCASNLVPWAGPDWMSFPRSQAGSGTKAGE